MPSTETVRYTGYALGYSGTSQVCATITIDVNFGISAGAGTVTLQTTGSKNLAFSNWVPNESLELMGGALTYSGNQISGAVSGASNTGRSELVNARFYGPNAEEIGGTFSVR